MIRSYLEHHIMCDQCGVNGSLEFAHMWDSTIDPHEKYNYHPLEAQEGIYETKRELLQRAKKLGWKRFKGKDYCPNCCAEKNWKK
jgi:hypothetical protein